MLVVAGGEQGGAGEQVGERIQVVGEGVEFAEFFEQIAAGVALHLALPAADGIGGGGQGRALARTDVLADNAAVDAAGSGVVAAAAAGFPAHGPAPKRRNSARATQHASPDRPSAR